jgi:hypothetical protein
MAKRKYRKKHAFYEIGSMRIPVRARIPDAPLIVNGAAADALLGVPGMTIGCAMSNMVYRHKDLPVNMVAPPQVTSRTLVVPTKLDKNGLPCEALVYQHNYRRITDANDKGTLKQMVKEQPRVMERSFTFYPASGEIRDQSNRNIGLRPTRGPNNRKNRRPYLKGSLLRAQKAGLVTPAFAAMTKQANPDVS